jgi:hypothetical protein
MTITIEVVPAWIMMKGSTNTIDKMLHSAAKPPKLCATMDASDDERKLTAAPTTVIASGRNREFEATIELQDSPVRISLSFKIHPTTSNYTNMNFNLLFPI